MVSRFGIYMVNLFHGLCQLRQLAGRTIVKKSVLEAAPCS
jgi:hypothetical protein